VSSQTNAEAPDAPIRGVRGAAVDLALASSLLVVMAVTGHPSLALGALLACLTLIARLVASVIVRLWHAVLGRRDEPRNPPSLPRLRRGLRVITLASAFVLVPAGISYLSDLSRPSNSPLGIRTVEWLRDNGAAWVVADIENVYYSLTAPSKGGPGLHSLPLAGLPVERRSHTARRVRTRPSYRPPRVRPLMRPRLPGEGVWRPAQRTRPSEAPGVLVTTFRPERDYPRLIAGVAWIDWHHTRLALYPGLREPPGAASHATGVPSPRRARLLATFNSGFKHKDSQGGFFASGRLWEPLVPGQGTLIATRSGQFDVRAWHGGARPSPGIALARQNLPLIVDHGRLNPNLGNGPQWGFTVHSAVLVWRSGVGVDRRGNLIYAAANDMTVNGLARALVHAGAVRAIELDINSFWISFITYARRGAGMPRNLLPDMTRPATRYLTPDDRDFFAVFRR
jgi:hypothetical protein